MAFSAGNHGLYIPYSHGHRTFDPALGSIHRLSRLLVLLTYGIALLYICWSFELGLLCRHALNLWVLHNYLHFILNICIHSFAFHAC